MNHTLARRLTGRAVHADAHNDRLLRLTLILVCLNLVWRCVRYAAGFPLFGDEAFVANNFLLKDFWGLAGGLEHYQIVSLVFLWSEWVAVQLAGLSEWSLRFVSFAAGLLSVFVFVRVAFLFLPRVPAVFAVGIFCASYYPVRHATEVKSYSLDILCAMLLLLTALRYVREPDRRRWLMWTLVCGLGAWASYPSIFVALGSCLVLFLDSLRRTRLSPAPVVMTGIAAAAGFGVMYLLVGSLQAAEGSEFLRDYWADTFPPLTDPARLPAWFAHVHLGKMFAYPNGTKNGGSTLTFVLFCVGVWVLWRRGRRVALGLLLAPFLLTFAAAGLHAYPYGGNARVAQHLAPAICLLAGAGLAHVLRIRRGPDVFSKRGLVVLGLFMLIIVGGAIRDVVKPYREPADLGTRNVIWKLNDLAPESTQWIFFGTWRPRDHAPNLYQWGGWAARLRFYVLRDAEPAVYWGPTVDEVTRLPNRPIWLFAYQHRLLQFPEAQFAAYLEALRQRFGAYQRETYELDRGTERLVVYRFKVPG